MKKLASLFVVFILLFSSCNNEEGIPKPYNFSASDGSACGTVYIDFELDDKTESVEVYRREKGTEQWQLIIGTDKPFFDFEGYWGGTGMPPGKVFEYKMRACCGDQNEFTEVDEGYAYVIIPVDSITITSTETSNLLKWNEGNNEGFINNDVEIRFDIFRSESPDGGFVKIATVNHDRSYFDYFYDNPDMHGKTFYYKINTWFYPYEPTFVEGKAIAANGSGNDNPTVEYTISEMGQVTSTLTGGITQLRERVIDNVPYVAFLKDYSVYGKPALFKLNGSVWEEVWTTIPDVEYSKTSFAVSGINSYLAGVQGSLSVYQWNGSTWSENLAPDNLGQADGPSSVDIETYEDDLYMAIEQYPDYDLQVLKYTGTGWDTIGGDVNGVIASGDIFEAKIEHINGTLYLWYMLNNTLIIKHLNGVVWETDLQWTQEWLSDIQVIKNASNLYFSSNTRSGSYNGGVYRVINTTSVENLTTEDAEWFKLGAFALAVDSEGDLVVSSIKYESAEVIYPYLNVFDGANWKTIAGDFTDGLKPVSLSVVGTDIYYLYGDASTENASGFPTNLKARKLVK